MSEKRKVLLPQPIEQESVDYLLKNGCELIVCEKCEYEEVAEKIKDAEALVLRTGIKITEDLLKHAENLKIISRTGGGVDNIDLKASTAKGIIVTSSIGANTSSVIEHTIALILTLAKRIPIMDQAVRAGNFKIRYQNLSVDIRDKILGIVGFGRIGSGLAEICRNSFHMKIIAHDDYLPDRVKKQYREWVDFTTLDTVVEQSDFISIHIPLTESTRGIINIDKLKKMKKSAIIINTSRGEVISEKDLIEALEKNYIAGAGLDVFENEPVEKNNPLLKMDNVVLTPHSAALTRECTVRMALEAVKRVVKYFNGEIPENIANPEALKT